MAQKYRKKPVVIEAELFDGSNHIDIYEFTNGQSSPRVSTNESFGMPLIIPTLEGDMIASPGDVIIKGVNGEFYPCKPDIFAKTYDLEE